MTSAVRAWGFLGLALAGLACGKVFQYPEPAPEQDAVACSDGVDNDLDGSVDCDDGDCTGFCRETSQAECTDEVDNDGDGLADASDPGCWPFHPPEARRCAESAGIDTIENFDLPAWKRIYSPWRRWGLSSAGFVVDSASHQGPERWDPLVAFRGSTTSGAELSANLGALVLQAPFAGNWQGFELSFSVSVPPQSFLRAAVVPIELAPSQDAPLEGPGTASLTLTLDSTRRPATFELEFDGERVVSELPTGDSSCRGALCDRRLGKLALRLEDIGFVATLTLPDGEVVEARTTRVPAEAARPVSRLVFWGGSTGDEAALLDDLRLKVSADWPCGYSAPQIPGDDCEHAHELGRFGETLSVARAPDGEYCAVILAGPPIAQTVLGNPQTEFVAVSTAVSAWRSLDGRSWSAAGALAPEGSLIGAAVASHAGGFALVVLSRDDDGVVRLAKSAAAACGEWDSLEPGAALFEDAEAPSYLAREDGDHVLFTRPPNDQTGRTLWRIVLDAPNATPELLAELPPEVLPPVSITPAGRDVVLTYPSAPTLQSVGGVGLLIGDRDLRHFRPVGSGPLLDLLPGSDLWGGHGRLAFDDRGIAAATFAWDAMGGTLLYAGKSSPGFAGAAFVPALLAVGTAELALSGHSFESGSSVASSRCGDGTCSPAEDCTSCKADCACSGPSILADAFTAARPWQLISTEPEPAASRYIDADPPGLSWTGAGPTWSVLPLERGVAGDFELSFDSFVGATDEFNGSCVFSVGLGVPSGRDEQDGPEVGVRRGIFAQLVPQIGWYNAVPLVVRDGVVVGETAAEVKADSTHLRDVAPTGGWSHVVLRREGNRITTRVPAQNGCGFDESSVDYVASLGELPALLMGFGGRGLEGCTPVLVTVGEGTNGYGSIKNLELRLLDDPDDCPEGQERCGGKGLEASCADLERSAEHCGTCGRNCDDNERCRAGRCVCVQEPNILDCDGSCVDVSSSVEHCGRCHAACPYTCVAGHCAPRGDCETPYALDPQGESVTIATTGGPVSWQFCSIDVRDPVVFSWTPAASGTAVITLDVSGTSLDTVLGISADLTCESFPVCNDDADYPNDLGSLLVVSVDAGVTYLIAAGILNDPQTSGQAASLNVELFP